jgi:hypothetical protein
VYVYTHTYDIVTYKIESQFLSLYAWEVLTTFRHTHTHIHKVYAYTHTYDIVTYNI